MKSADILTTAASLVSGDRDRQHGDKETNFGNICIMWNAYLAIRREPAAPLSPADVAEMMSLMKKARKHSGDFNADDYIDDAGYTAIAGELSA